MHLTRRQKEILDFVGRHIERKGYAPTIEEIGEHFGLSSLATVHKHLTNLQEKGFIKRAWNRSRALELVPTAVSGARGRAAAARPRRGRHADRGHQRAPRRSSCPRTWSAAATPTCCRSRATR